VTAERPGGEPALVEERETRSREKTRMRRAVEDWIAHPHKPTQVPPGFDRHRRRLIHGRRQRRRHIGGEYRRAEQCGRARETKDVRTNHDFVLSSSKGPTSPQDQPTKPRMAANR